MSIDGITENLTANHFKIINDQVYVKNNGNPGILLIHAHWCGHCKHFIPTFKNLSRKLNRYKHVYPCYAIESDELTPVLSNALSVQGFPTIKFFDQYGKIIGNYDGNRSEQSILENICKVYHHCIEYH